jgi:hypothetical protein
VPGKRRNQSRYISLTGPRWELLNARVAARAARYEREHPDEDHTPPPSHPQWVETMIKAAQYRLLHLRQDVGLAQYWEAWCKAETQVLAKLKSSGAYIPTGEPSPAESEASP